MRNFGITVVTPISRCGVLGVVNLLVSRLPTPSRRGKESLKLGYSISQVVHGYGALCQAITEYVEESSNQTASPREFNRLNFCLDIAIAEAVTEFNRGQRENAERDEVRASGISST